MNTAVRTATRTPSNVNYGNQLKELNEKFGRLVKQLGANNKRGSMRYDFETNFSYALHEFTLCPIYMQEKVIERSNVIINNLINQLKQLREVKPEAKLET